MPVRRLEVVDKGGGERNALCAISMSATTSRVTTLSTFA